MYWKMYWKTAVFWCTGEMYWNFLELSGQMYWKTAVFWYIEKCTGIIWKREHVRESSGKFSCISLGVLGFWKLKYFGRFAASSIHSSILLCRIISDYSPDRNSREGVISGFLIFFQAFQFIITPPPFVKIKKNANLLCTPPNYKKMLESKYMQILLHE